MFSIFQNPFPKDLTLWNVPRKMEESTMTELSACTEEEEGEDEYED